VKGKIMSDTHFKDAICTVSTRNLDPSIITPEINVAFMSDSSSKLSKYIQDAVGVVLADDYVVSPYVTSAASMSGVAVIIRATGQPPENVVYSSIYDLDKKIVPVPAESFMDIMEGYAGEDLNTQLTSWEEALKA
jgi:hypothetical protein